MIGERTYRTTGKETSGRLYKGRVFSEEKPSEAATAAASARAFGSQSQRFKSAETLTPGPGKYDVPSAPGTAPNLSAANSDSTQEKWKSKPKCFGISARFTTKQYKTLAPGPGSYNSLSSSSSHVLKSVFVLPKPRPSKAAKLQTPAPWQYAPKVSANPRSAASCFKSSTQRLSGTNPVPGPSPWQYTPNFELVRSTSAQLTSAFKLSVKEKREQLNVYDPYQRIPPETNPGPGSYDRPSVFEDHPPGPSSFFIKSDLDRFGRSSKPNLRAWPEPGSYSQGLEERDRVPVSGAVFMSESEREWIKKGQMHPGPAFYKAQLLPKKLSFLRNDSSKWV